MRKHFWDQDNLTSMSKSTSPGSLMRFGSEQGLALGSFLGRAEGKYQKPKVQPEGKLRACTTWVDSPNIIKVTSVQSIHMVLFRFTLVQLPILLCGIAGYNKTNMLTWIWGRQAKHINFRTEKIYWATWCALCVSDEQLCAPSQCL